MPRKKKDERQYAGDKLIEPEVTRDPCPLCGSMLYTDGTCTNMACESYPPPEAGGLGRRREP